MTLTEAIHDVFGPDGWLVRQGRHHLPVQLEYALAVADWLTGEPNKPVGLFEGDTGTGKTLGYLFPLLLHWTRTRERFVVATHTVNLQNQLMSGDLELVEQYLIEKDLPLPNIQQRLGMRHFVDRHRVADLAAENPESTSLQLFREWAEHSAEYGPGLLDEWTELYGPLPEGVTPNMVCLTSLSADDANKPYSQAKADTRDADGILTSHMMVLLEARSSRPILGLAEEGMVHLLLDEADQVPAGAEPLSNRRLQVREVIRQLQDLVGRGSAGLDKALYEGIQMLREADQRLQGVGESHNAPELILDDRNEPPAIVTHTLGEIQATASMLKSKIERSSLYRTQKDMHAQEVLSLLEWVTNFSQVNDAVDRNVHALAWSPVLNIPSLLYQQANPAMFVSRLWRTMGLRVGFTSATLGTTTAADDKPRFVPFRAQLGIAQDQIATEVQLSPRSFGDMAFTLADPSLPKPVMDHDDETGARLSKIWLNYTARMVTAASQDGPTLVLVSSYSEAAQLGKQLGAINPIIHRYGHSLQEARDSFRAGDSAVLITPAAWQGSSIRDLQGRQLIRNLVITRIPFLPPNGSAERLAAHLAEAGGRTTPSQAVAHERLKLRDRALIKFRQGMGRLIRQQGDQGRVWLCDPRFPRPGEKSTNRFFLGAIPTRFHDAWRNADLLRADGRSEIADKPTSTIVSEMLDL